MAGESILGKIGRRLVILVSSQKENGIHSNGEKDALVLQKRACDRKGTHVTCSDLSFIERWFP